MTEAAQAAAGILVVDYGSQYTMLIARRLRELGVYSVIVAPGQLARAAGYKGVILSGGPESALGDNGAKLSPEELAVLAGKPVLGVCYGMQIMALALGGTVEPGDQERNYGPGKVKVLGDDPLLADIGAGNSFDAWLSHGDHVTKLPEGFAELARDETGALMAIGSSEKGWYGLQFHPEVTHTDRGRDILRRFAGDVCGCPLDWSMPAFEKQMIGQLREQIGDDRVLVALSGGVDSAVMAQLLERAVPGQLVCVLVDNGLLRAGEVDSIKRSFAELGDRLVVADAKDRFLDALKGVVDPEEKRRAIGATFIDVFKDEAARQGEIRWLGQGTIYPDVVESAGTGSSTTAAIKSHHNVGGLPEDLGFDLVEPLRLLFKDEVRKLGRELGLPSAMVDRHPFPGPGLAVRVLGEVTAERLETARAADAIYMAELRESGWYAKVAQAFAVLLPVDSVGVQGDGRTYANVLALRAVVTDDFMTADWARLPEDLLARCSSRIINEVAQVNRVVYDISSKPPATVEWE